MRWIVKIYTCSLLFLMLASCGQSNSKKDSDSVESQVVDTLKLSTVELTNQLEINAFDCLTKFLDSKGIDWKALKLTFENTYLKSGKINQQDSIENLYWAIFKLYEMPYSRYLNFDTTNLNKLIDKMQLSDDELNSKKQLNCLLDVYKKEKQNLNIYSTFYFYGSLLKTIHDSKIADRTIISISILSSTKKSDYNKELYQLCAALLLM